MEQNLTRIFTLFGGLALFLYGMDALSHSLETAAGSRLKSLLAAVTGSPVRGVLAGAAVTAVLQSSSAVTVMVLGFVSAGLLTLRQAVPVIFGCNIGTTVTAQLLAFRLEDVRGLVLLAGLLLCFACAGQKARAIGQAVFAFGLLFEGIADMGTAMEPLAQSPVFVHWLGRVRQHPWLGLLAGLGMTLTVQSSSATIALLQNFAARPGLDGSSLLGLAGALPVLLGDNIGTTITAVLASLSASRDAKRVAAAHAVFNLTGAAGFCAGLPLYVRLTAALSPKGPELAVREKMILGVDELTDADIRHAGVAAVDPADGAVCVPPCAGPGSAVSFYWTNIPIAHILKGMKPTAEQKGNIAMRQKIGRVCMVLGALLLLAAALLAYNKWDASRADKASQEVLGELEQTLNAAIEEKAKSDTVALQPELDPTQEMTVTELNGWDYIGYLSIPSIGLELPVMSQWSYAGLKIAPGRYSGSTYADNMVVCAHNYAKHFSPIKWLTEGAQVYFTDMDGMRWTYEVSYVENLQPTQIEEMTEKTEESDEWDLTLFTCTTGGSARCAVRCVRTGYPALTTETAE